MEGTLRSNKVWDQEYKQQKVIPSTSTLRPSSSFREYVAQHRNNLEGATLIDIGCGNGRNSLYALKNGFTRVHGFDYSNEAIKLAKRNARAAHFHENSYRFYTHDLTTGLPEQDNSFDLAIDMTTSHLLDEDQITTLFKEVYRILKPKGEFLMFTIISNKLSGKEVMDVEMGGGSAVEYFIHDYKGLAMNNSFKVAGKAFYESQTHIGNNLFDRRYLKLLLVKS